MKRVLAAALAVVAGSACGGSGVGFPPATYVPGVEEIVLGEGTAERTDWQFVAYRDPEHNRACHAFKERFEGAGAAASGNCGQRPANVPAVLCTLAVGGGMAGGEPLRYGSAQGLAADDVSAVTLVFADGREEPADVVGGAERLGINPFLVVFPLMGSGDPADVEGGAPDEIVAVVVMRADGPVRLPPRGDEPGRSLVGCPDQPG